MINVEEFELLKKYHKWKEPSHLEKITVMEKRVIIVRWLGIIIGVITVPFLGIQDAIPMYLLIAYACLHNIFFQLVVIPFRNQWLLKPAVLTIGDIIMTSAAIYLTGGLKSDFYLIYFLLAVLAAIRFGRREALLSISISTVMYVIVVLKAADYYLTSINIAEIILRMGFVMITGIFVGYLADRTRQIELDLAKELDKAHEQLNRSISLLNQSLELKDVLNKGVEQACHLINAELSMILMDEANANFLANDFQDNFLKPYLSCRRTVCDFSENDIQYFSILFPNLSKSQMVKQKVFYRNKEVAVFECSVDEAMSNIFSTDKGDAYYFISIPLFSGEKKLGTLYIVKFYNPFKMLRETQVDLLYMYAHSISSAITNSLVYTQSKLQAITDSVTGLYNHRYLQEKIKIELDNSLANDKQLSLIILDIDSFKQFNDTYGHSVGDIALKWAAQLIQESISKKGFAARYGGDEFVIVLPSMSNKEACEVAEVIRRKVSAGSYSQIHEDLASLKISLGVATAPLSGKTPEEIFNAADLALYIAKYSGKNMVKSALEFSGYQKLKESQKIPKYLDSKKSISLQKTFSKNHSIDFEMIKAFIAAVDARDHYTYDHSVNVSNYAVKLAKKMNLSDEEVERIRLGALLHDIGKIGIPDSILNKDGQLINAEFEIVKQHPIIGIKIIQPIHSMGVYSPIIKYHHEWFNGNGYPNGLKGSGIPLGARIVSVCDAYDALTTDRPYRGAMSKEKAMQMIQERVGKQFDPMVWDDFRDIIINDIEANGGETIERKPVLETV